MNERELKRPVRSAHGRFLEQARSNGMSQQLLSQASVTKARHPRRIPTIVVELGELVGLIYRSDRAQPGRLRTYIHFMQNPPRLVSNVKGTQLYVVGGSYRVTQRGIEG